MISNNVAIAIYFNKNRSVANSLIGVGSSIGDMVMSPVVQRILHLTDLKTCFLALSGVHVIPGLFSLTYNPNVQSESQVNQSAPRKGESTWGHYKLVFRNGGIQLFILGFATADTSYALTLGFMVCTSKIVTLKSINSMFQLDSLQS